MEGYEVTWREDGEERSGSLAVGTDGVVLTGPEGDVLREVRFDALVAVTLHPAAEGRRQVELHELDDTQIEIESAIGGWILRDVVESLLAHALARDDVPLRFLVPSETAVAARSWHPGLGVR